MIAGLTLLVLLLFFGGGQETILLNPHMEKNVKSIVVNKDAKKEILKIIKEIGKSQKEFIKKELKPTVKQFEALNSNYHSTRDQFTKLTDPYFSKFSTLQKNFIDSELKVKSLMSEKEWNEIMEKVIQTPDKEKNKKDLEKYSLNVSEMLNKACEDNISDKNNLEKAKKLVLDYKSRTDTLIFNFLNLSYKHQEKLHTYSASKADYEEAFKNVLNLRKEKINFFIDMQLQLREFIPESNWKSMAKELSESMKKGLKET